MALFAIDTLISIFQPIEDAIFKWSYLSSAVSAILFSIYSFTHIDPLDFILTFHLKMWFKSYLLISAVVSLFDWFGYDINIGGFRFISSPQILVKHLY